MAQKVQVDIVANDKTGDTLEKTSAKVGGFAASAQKAGAGFKKFLGSDIMSSIGAGILDGIGGALTDVLNKQRQLGGPDVKKWDGAVGKIQGLLAGKFAEAFNKVLPLLADAATWLADNLPGALDTAGRFFTTVGDTATTFGNNVKGVAETIGGFVTSVGDGLEQARSTVTTKLDEAGRTISEFPGKGAAAIRGGIGGFISAGGDLIGGLISGVRDRVGDFVGEARRVAEQALGTIKRVLGIASPSREGHRVGGWLVEGLEDGVEEQAPQLLDRGRTLAARTVAALTPTRRPTLPAAAGLPGAGAAPVIYVTVGPTSDKVAIGRAIADALKAFYDSGGRRP